MLFEMKYYKIRADRPMQVVNPSGGCRGTVRYILPTLDRVPADDDIFDVMLNDEGFRIEGMDGRTWRHANGLIETKMANGLLSGETDAPGTAVALDIDFLTDFIHVVADEAAAAAEGIQGYRCRPCAEVLAELNQPRLI